MGRERRSTSKCAAFRSRSHVTFLNVLSTTNDDNTRDMCCGDSLHLSSAEMESPLWDGIKLTKHAALLGHVVVKLGILAVSSETIAHLKLLLLDARSISVTWPGRTGNLFPL